MFKEITAISKNYAIVKIDNVCLAFLYIPCFFNWLLKYVAISTAMLSTLSSSLPNLG